MTCVYLQAIYLITEPNADCLGDAPHVRTREIFYKMDLNGDGVLSKEEFVRGCLEDIVLYQMLAARLD